jgi:integrase
VYEEKIRGRWIATLPQPGRRPLTFCGKTMAEAMAAREEYRTSVIRGEREMGSGKRTNKLDGMRMLTWGDWFDYWLEEICKPRYGKTGKNLKPLSPKTYDAYEYYHRACFGPLRKFRLVGKGALDETVVQKWFNDLLGKFSETTCQVAHRTLVTAMSKAVEHRKATGVLANPALLLHIKPHAPKKKTPPDPAVISAVRDAARASRLELAVLIGLEFGLRTAELAGLRYADFNFSLGSLTVRRRVLLLRKREGRGGVSALDGLKMKDESGSRTLYFDPAVWGPLLQQHQQRQLEFQMRNAKKWRGPRADDPNQYLFCNRYGAVLSPSSLYKEVKQIYARAGCPGRTLHDNRHDFVGIKAMQGVDLKTISVLAGHASVAITEAVYTHLSDAHLREAMTQTTDQWLARAQARNASTG